AVREDIAADRAAWRQLAKIDTRPPAEPGRLVLAQVALRQLPGLPQRQHGRRESVGVHEPDALGELVQGLVVERLCSEWQREQGKAKQQARRRESIEARLTRRR